MLLTALLIAAGLAIVAFTWFVTAVDFDRLPRKIPMQFDLRGVPRWYGPRGFAWMMPIVQVLFCAMFAVPMWAVIHEPPKPAAPAGLAFFAVVMAGVFFAAQNQILTAARTNARQFNVRPFFFSTLGASALAIVVLILTLG